MTNELDQLLTITDLSETLKAETPAGVASSGPRSLRQPMHNVENVEGQRPQRRRTQRPGRILDDIDCHAAHHQADADIRSITPRSVPGSSERKLRRQISEDFSARPTLVTYVR
jgi:hypothetical protein